MDLNAIVEYVVYLLEIMGALVIIWGSFSAFLAFVLLEIKRLKGNDVRTLRENLRYHLGSYLMLGLELLIAADLVETIRRPKLGWEVLIELGVMVILRIAISYFLKRELMAFKQGHLGGP